MTQTHQYPLQELMYKPTAPSVFCGATWGTTWYFVMPFAYICTETSRVTKVCMALWSGHGWFYIQALWEYPCNPGYGEYM